MKGQAILSSARIEVLLPRTGPMLGMALESLLVKLFKFRQNNLVSSFSSNLTDSASKKGCIASASLCFFSIRSPSVEIFFIRTIGSLKNWCFGIVHVCIFPELAFLFSLCRNQCFVIDIHWPRVQFCDGPLTQGSYG